MRLIRALLTAGAQANISCEQGQPPLFEAARSGNHQALWMLISAMPESINSQDTRGRTALMLAIENKNMASIMTLLKTGIDIHLKDNDGMTAVDLAEKMRLKEVSDLLAAHQADNSEKNSGPLLNRVCL